MSTMGLSIPEVRAELVWATLQSYAIFQRISQAGFKSDPVITTAMSNFIMKHRVDKSDFDVLKVEVDKVSKNSKALDVDVKTLKSTVSEHGSKLVQLQKGKQDKKSG